MTDERTQFNLGVVGKWGERDWSSWFFRAFRENDARPLRLLSREEVTAELEELFELATEDIRDPMQHGLVDALRMWDEGFHGRGVLIELAWTAGKIRAVYAVPSLLKILVDHRDRMLFDDSFFDAADVLVGVVLGFATKEEQRDEAGPTIEAVCHGLFYDDAVAPELSAPLALSIAICNRSRFVEVFDRFVVLQARAEEYFVAEDVIAQFATHLTNGAIRSTLDLLSDEAYAYAAIAGTDAGLWTSLELLGELEKKGQRDRPRKASQKERPEREPRETYDLSERRYMAAAKAHAKQKRYVLDAATDAMLTQKKPRPPRLLR